jgi:hypothetical protein
MNTIGRLRLEWWLLDVLIVCFARPNILMQVPVQADLAFELGIVDVSMRTNCLFKQKLEVNLVMQLTNPLIVHHTTLILTDAAKSVMRTQFELDTVERDHI